MKSVQRCKGAAIKIKTQMLSGFDPTVNETGSTKAWQTKNANLKGWAKVFARL